MQIIIAQKNFLVGDVQGNTEVVIQTLFNHCDNCENDGKAGDNKSSGKHGGQQPGAGTIVLFPELTLVGYPPEDLLFKHELYKRVDQGLERIKQATRQTRMAVVVGHPVIKRGRRYNALSFIAEGAVLLQYCKQALPNYSVFDEVRYFSPAQESGVVEYHNNRIGLLICEDLRQQPPVDAFQKLKPDLVLVANASPFHQGQLVQRKQLVSHRARQFQCPVVYGNLVGGQDELVFDGASMAFDASGHQLMQLAQFEELTAQLKYQQGKLSFNAAENAELLSPQAELYQSLVLGVRDYVQKNGFKGAVIGLSGGIDSALTLAIAVDALGAEQVMAVMMPFRYTSSMSLEDAQAEAKILGVKYEVISIEPMYEAFMQQLSPLFKNNSPDTTEENLQSRCRGVILMALSNKLGQIVLTTGNKSEMAVGYATLYGDMAGGFGVLKDVFKMDVFKLARYRNRQQQIIPQRVITRPPSAELSPDQKDEDSLPPYAELDVILSEYIEKERSYADIVQLGFDKEVVERVIKLVDMNEHKRRQSPPGVRVTSRAFGRDHRYPITSAYRTQPLIQDESSGKSHKKNPQLHIENSEH